MRYFLNAGGVLALTIALVHVGISASAGPTKAPSITRSLHSIDQTAVAPTSVTQTDTAKSRFALVPNGSPSLAPLTDFQLRQLPISWIGTHAPVTLNRTWRLDSDLDPRLAPNVVLASAATVATAPLSGLADQVRGLKGSFQPIATSELDAAWANLKAKVDHLSWMLSGQAANEKAAADGWKSFLHWDELQSAVSQGHAVKPDELRHLAAFVRAAQSSETLDQHGDEVAQNQFDFRTALQDVGTALHQYRVLLLANGPEGKGQFDSRLDALAKTLSTDPAGWNSSESLSVGQSLGELQAEGESPALVNQLHATFDNPNLIVRAPAEFIAKLSQQEPVDEVNNNFRDNILDTDITGSTHIQGQKTVTLIPNDQQAILGVTFNGTVTSRTVGYHPPVTVSSHGTTELHGTVYVTISADGFTSGRACSHACTHTCIDCINVCGGWLVQRIAPKKVYKSKPEAECVAGEHAEQRLTERIESDATESLGKSNHNYQTKIRAPLMSWGAMPRIHYSTTASALTVAATEANSFQLAAPASDPAPAIDGNPFLAVRLHQSFINNLLAVSLGGRTVSQAQFEGGVGNLLGPEAAAKARKSGESPQEIREREAKMTQAEREEFEQKLKFMKANRKITFAEADPVTVDFTDNGFTITIRGLQFQGEDLDRPAGAENITAHYKLVQGANGPKQAARVGELDIAPPSWRKLSPLQRSTLRTAEVDKLRARFNDLLPPTIDFQGLDFSNSAPPWDKIGAMQAYRVTCGAGWLAIDWKAAD